MYEVPCKDCPEMYVGETKRTLNVRLSEHGQAVRSRERHCSSCSKDKPLHQLGRCHSPNMSRRVLAEEDCGSHPDREILPEHEHQQWPSPSCGLELNPKPTPYPSPLAPPPPLHYSFSLCLVNSMSIIHDYYFYAVYFYC